MTLKKLFSVRTGAGDVASTFVNLDHVIKVVCGYRGQGLHGARSFYCSATLANGESVEAPNEDAARDMHYALLNEPADSMLEREPLAPGKTETPIQDERYFKQV